jgi:isochorismate synthase EntC
VHARLRGKHTLLQLVAELHPTPAVGGSPRGAALRFIRENEEMDRGWYAAPVGWMQKNRGEFAVALRSALISGSDALLFAGCGVVADSDPATEYAESLLKLRPMQSAITASLRETDIDTEMAHSSAFSGDAT